MTQAQTQLTQAQTELALTREDLSTAQTVLASLQGESGQGAVVRTSTGSTVFVVKLPQPRPGRIYQLWRMQVQGNPAPLSVGLFTVDQLGYATFDLDQQP